MNTPTLGSRWAHKNGARYTVLGVSNTAVDRLSHEPDVIYVGDNGNLCTHPLSTWHQHMTQVPVQVPQTTPINAIGIAATCAWTEIRNALVKDGTLSDQIQRCGSSMRAWIVDLVEREFAYTRGGKAIEWRYERRDQVRLPAAPTLIEREPGLPEKINYVEIYSCLIRIACEEGKGPPKHILVNMEAD